MTPEREIIETTFRHARRLPGMDFVEFKQRVLEAVPHTSLVRLGLPVIERAINDFAADMEAEAYLGPMER